MEQITFRQSQDSDVEKLADLRAVVLRDDLTRLGRYNEEKVRERFRHSFDSTHTWIMEMDGSLVGCIALKPTSDEYLLEHFYIHPHYQGKGVGSHVLQSMLDQKDVQGKRVNLNVLQGSSARRLYERFGFQVDQEDAIDVYMSLFVEG